MEQASKHIIAAAEHRRTIEPQRQTTNERKSHRKKFRLRFITFLEAAVPRPLPPPERLSFPPFSLLRRLFQCHHYFVFLLLYSYCFSFAFFSPSPPRLAIIFSPSPSPWLSSPPSSGPDSAKVEEIETLLLRIYIIFPLSLLPYVFKLFLLQFVKRVCQLRRP